MALKAGSVANFNGSLAEAMEQAFQNEWLDVFGEALPGGGEQERKILFAAIAQGLLSYLQTNIDGSLEVDVSVTQVGGGGIQSTGGETEVRILTE